NIIYAATRGGGVIKSADAGKSWRLVAEGIPIGSRVVERVAVDPQDPNTVYAATVQGGIYKTTDGGESWLPLSCACGTVIGIAIDPQSPNTIFASTGGNGIIRSDDFGATWRASGLPGEFVTALTIDPVDSLIIYAGTHAEFGGTEGTVFKSDDGGISWTPVAQLNHTILEPIIDPQKHNTV